MTETTKRKVFELEELLGFPIQEVLSTARNGYWLDYHKVSTRIGIPFTGFEWWASLKKKFGDSIETLMRELETVFIDWRQS